jgi:hypothetical protein
VTESDAEPIDPKLYADAIKALRVCKQALLEVAHAQNAGSSWYTHGHDGLYRQVAMWVRNGNEAINSVLTHVDLYTCLTCYRISEKAPCKWCEEKKT